MDEIPVNYEALGAEIGRLVMAKRKAYGDSFGRSAGFLKVLWPTGVPPEAYDLLLAFVRFFDKMCRMANDPTAFGEDPARDLVGYALLLVAANVAPTKDVPAPGRQDTVTTGPPPFRAHDHARERKWIHDATCAHVWGTCTCDPVRAD